MSGSIQAMGHREYRIGSIFSPAGSLALSIEHIGALVVIQLDSTALHTRLGIHLHLDSSSWFQHSHGQGRPTHGVLSSHLLVVYPVSKPALVMAALKPRAAEEVGLWAWWGSWCAKD